MSALSFISLVFLEFDNPFISKKDSNFSTLYFGDYQVCYSIH